MEKKNLAVSSGLQLRNAIYWVCSHATSGIWLSPTHSHPTLPKMLLPYTFQGLFSQHNSTNQGGINFTISPTLSTCQVLHPCLIYILSLTHDNDVRWFVLLSPSYRWENWDLGSHTKWQNQTLNPLPIWFQRPNFLPRGFFLWILHLGGWIRTEPEAIPLSMTWSTQNKIILLH